MSKQEERKPISKSLRKQVLTRDNHACRKCCKAEDLELHHVVPFADGQQIDTLENLITLCKYCHREWEHIVYPRTEEITFEEWLNIPPALHLIKAFAAANLWKDDITAKDARDGIMQAYQFLRDCVAIG